MDAGTILGFVGALLGFVGAVAGVIVAWRFGNLSIKVASAQQRLATQSAASDWLGELRAWASEAIEVLSEASYTCGHYDPSDKDCAEKLLRCRFRISALIDTGRFFLPNHFVDTVGVNKPSAYRGRRHAALDPIVAAERVLSGEVETSRFKSRKEAVVAMQREFVSAIQKIIAPDLHNKVIAQLILDAQENRSGDPTLGGLLPVDPNAPTGADRFLYGR